MVNAATNPVLAFFAVLSESVAEATSWTIFPLVCNTSDPGR
jgi:hypothetical protein